MTQHEAAEEPVRKTLSTDDWKKIEEKLSGAYGGVKLMIDGFAVTLQVQRIGSRKYAIVVYVDGKFRGEWLLKNCEERRRFFDMKARHLLPKKTRDEAKKFNKRYPKHAVAGADALFEYWVPWWTSFPRLKAHLLKNNENIEWLNRGI